MSWWKRLFGVKDATGDAPPPSNGEQFGNKLRCGNCGNIQGEGAWEKEMDQRARAMGSSGFVNLSAPEQCLKCGSTDLTDASAPKQQSEEPSKEVSDFAAEFARLSRTWERAHTREQASVSLSSDAFRNVLSETRPIKEQVEKKIQLLLADVRSKGITDEILRLLQRKGETGALSLMDAYL